MKTERERAREREREFTGNQATHCTTSISGSHRVRPSSQQNIFTSEIFTGLATESVWQLHGVTCERKLWLFSLCWCYRATTEFDFLLCVCFLIAVAAHMESH